MDNGNNEKLGESPRHLRSISDEDDTIFCELGFPSFGISIMNYVVVSEFWQTLRVG